PKKRPRHLMCFWLPRRSEREECPTPAVTSTHAEQQIQRKIHPRTAIRSGHELHQCRWRPALLRDSPRWRYPCSHHSEAKTAWHRHVALQEGGSEQGKALRAAAHAGTDSSCPLTRLTTAEGTCVAPGTARGRRALCVQNVWNGT